MPSSSDYVSLELDYEVELIELDATVPSIVVAVTGAPGPGVFAYDGSQWLQTTSRVFIRKVGDPLPTGLMANDIVLQNNE